MKDFPYFNTDQAGCLCLLQKIYLCKGHSSETAAGNFHLSEKGGRIKFRKKPDCAAGPFSTLKVCILCTNKGSNNFNEFTFEKGMKFC